MKRLALTLLTTLYLSVAAGQSHNTTGMTEDNIRCSNCHDCDVPTKSNPCLKACPRGSFITVHHSPAEAPALITLNHAGMGSDLYGSVAFSHRLHADMAQMSGGCTSCHHYNPPGGVLPCRDCHELGSKRIDLSKAGLKGAYHRQCGGCHRTWGGTLDCNSCHFPHDSTGVAKAPIESAHAAATLPERLVFESGYEDAPIVTFYHNEHVRTFAIECATCHTSERCDHCHAKRKPEASSDQFAEEAHDRCGQCHDTSENCTQCHGTAVKGPFNHGKRTGFALATYHAKNRCQACHGKSGRFKGLNKKCSSCHGTWDPASFDHSKTGLELDEVHREFECEVCHTEKDYLKKPVCGTCHDDKSYPEAIPGRNLH